MSDVPTSITTECSFSRAPGFDHYGHTLRNLEFTGANVVQHSPCRTETIGICQGGSAEVQTNQIRSVIRECGGVIVSTTIPHDADHGSHAGRCGSIKGLINLLIGGRQRAIGDPREGLDEDGAGAGGEPEVMRTSGLAIVIAIQRAVASTRLLATVDGLKLTFS